MPGGHRGQQERRHGDQQRTSRHPPRSLSISPLQTARRLASRCKVEPSICCQGPDKSMAHSWHEPCSCLRGHPHHLDPPRRGLCVECLEPREWSGFGIRGRLVVHHCRRPKSSRPSLRIRVSRSAAAPMRPNRGSLGSSLPSRGGQHDRRRASRPDSGIRSPQLTALSFSLTRFRALIHQHSEDRPSAILDDPRMRRALHRALS